MQILAQILPTKTEHQNMGPRNVNFIRSLGDFCIYTLICSILHMSANLEIYCLNIHH